MISVIPNINRHLYDSNTGKSLCGLSIVSKDMLITRRKEKVTCEQCILHFKKIIKINKYVHIDWKKVSLEIKYIAMDSNGDWFGFISKPTFLEEVGLWDDKENIIFPLTFIKISVKLNPKDTLIKKR